MNSLLHKESYWPWLEGQWATAQGSHYAAPSWYPTFLFSRVNLESVLWQTRDGLASLVVLRSPSHMSTCWLESSMYFGLTSLLHQATGPMTSWLCHIRTYELPTCWGWPFRVCSWSAAHPQPLSEARCLWFLTCGSKMNWTCHSMVLPPCFS